MYGRLLAYTLSRIMTTRSNVFSIYSELITVIVLLLKLVRHDVESNRIYLNELVNMCFHFKTISGETPLRQFSGTKGLSKRRSSVLSNASSPGGTLRRFIPLFLYRVQVSRNINNVRERGNAFFVVFASHGTRNLNRK